MIEKTGSTPKQGEKPLAILIGGGTASGKTTIRKAIIEKELIERQIRAATVDPDNIKEYITCSVIASLVIRDHVPTSLKHVSTRRGWTV
ncbi:zeta toxin family protein [Virgibacillus necropolis]|nr:zeta toxin family protein [Virgibacillus necropolis]